MQNTNGKTYKMVVISLFTAIICIMTFTPLGYVPCGLSELTLLMIPVAIGAVILGPKIGAILGGVFGITSFLCCFGVGHPSAFGAFILAQNPLFTILICMVPRILVGFLTGLFANWLREKKSRAFQSVGYAIAGLIAALTNTVLFMGSVILFFWKNDAFQSKMTEWGIPTDHILPFVVGFAGINALIEAGVCTAAVCAICNALHSAGFLSAKKEKAA